MVDPPAGLANMEEEDRGAAVVDWQLLLEEDMPLDVSTGDAAEAAPSREHYHTWYMILSYLFTDVIINIIKYSSLCIYIEQQVKTAI